MELEKINIYRMTHIDNVPHILQHGITHKDLVNANPNFIGIGDISLIDTRSTKSVSVTNGDSGYGIWPSITLGDFIPFYFGVRMPMLYVVQHGGNFVSHATNAEDIVYLACGLEPIVENNIIYYFSDGHATNIFTTFYDSSSKLALPKIIDWNAIKTQYWSGAENLNLKRKNKPSF